MMSLLSLIGIPFICAWISGGSMQFMEIWIKGYGLLAAVLLLGAWEGHALGKQVQKLMQGLDLSRFLWEGFLDAWSSPFPEEIRILCKAYVTHISTSRRFGEVASPLPRYLAMLALPVVEWILANLVQMADPTASLSSFQGIFLVFAASCIDLVSMIPTILLESGLSIKLGASDLVTGFRWTIKASLLLRWAINIYPALHYCCWSHMAEVVLCSLLVILADCAAERFGFFSTSSSAAFVLLLNTSSLEVLCAAIFQGVKNQFLPGMVTAINLVLLSALFLKREPLQLLAASCRQAALVSNQWIVSLFALVPLMPKKTKQIPGGKIAFEESYSLLSSIEKVEMKPEIKDLPAYVLAALLSINDKIHGKRYEHENEEIQYYKAAFDKVLEAQSLPLLACGLIEASSRSSSSLVMLLAQCTLQAFARNEDTDADIRESTDRLLAPLVKLKESLTGTAVTLQADLSKTKGATFSNKLVVSLNGDNEEFKMEFSGSTVSLRLSETLLELLIPQLKLFLATPNQGEQLENAMQDKEVVVQLGTTILSSKYRCIKEFLSRSSSSGLPESLSSVSDLVESSKIQLNNVKERLEKIKDCEGKKHILEFIKDNLPRDADDHSHWNQKAHKFMIALIHVIRDLKHCDDPEFKDASIDAIDLCVRMLSLLYLRANGMSELSDRQVSWLLVLSFSVRIAIHKLIEMPPGTISLLFSNYLPKVERSTSPALDSTTTNLQKLEKKLEALEELQISSVTESYIPSLAQRVRKLGNEKPLDAIGVLGTVSAGKSTLINVLLGYPLLPSQSAATSAFPVELHLVPKNTVAELGSAVMIQVPQHNGKKAEEQMVSLEKAKKFLGELNDQMRKESSNLEVFHKAFVKVWIDVYSGWWGILQETIFFDIPGDGDLAIRKVEGSYREFLQTIPLFLVVTKPDQEGTDWESRVRELIPDAQVVVVVNKKDTLDIPGKSEDLSQIEKGCCANYLLDFMPDLRTNPSSDLLDFCGFAPTGTSEMFVVQGNCATLKFLYGRGNGGEAHQEYQVKKSYFYKDFGAQYLKSQVHKLLCHKLEAPEAFRSRQLTSIKKALDAEFERLGTTGIPVAARIEKPANHSADSASFWAFESLKREAIKRNFQQTVDETFTFGASWSPFFDDKWIYYNMYWYHDNDERSPAKKLVEMMMVQFDSLFREEFDDLKAKNDEAVWNSPALPSPMPSIEEIEGDVRKEVVSWVQGWPHYKVSWEPGFFSCRLDHARLSALMSTEVVRLVDQHMAKLNENLTWAAEEQAKKSSFLNFISE